MASNNSRARQRLFRINPHCFWCGKLTVLTVEAHLKLKHDAATVDHLYSRLHPDRKAARRGRGRLVMACNQCNKDRSNAETRGLMFVPKLAHKKVIAELTTITPLGAPAYNGSGSQPRMAVLNPPTIQLRERDYGWIDVDGELRPRDWEEHCKYFRVLEIPKRSVEVTHRAVVPRRQGLATIGELISASFR